MEMMTKWLRFVDSISDWTANAVSYLIIILALVVGYEVAARYIFRSPTVWVHEMSGMLFGTFIIIGGAYTFSKGGHVGMDIIYAGLRPRIRALLDMITFSLSLAFVGVLLWKGGQAAWKSIQLLEHDSTQWGPPIYPFRMMLPLGAFLLLLQMVAKFIRDFLIVIKGEPEG